MRANRIINFLRPSKLKLVFLVEWALFVAIEELRGRLADRHTFLVAVYPLAFFYLVACVLRAINKRTQKLAGGWVLFTLAVVLAVADQSCKSLIVTYVPYQASIPLVKGWLHLAHAHNLRGSWIVGTFDLGFINLPLLMGVAVLVLIGSGIGYRYYISTHNRSVMADVAFLGLFAGSASWICDLVIWGYVVDFISLPGVVTVDFKDILLALGIAAYVAEAMDDPKVSLSWKGWRIEGMELLQLGERVAVFSVNELCRLRQVLRRG